MTNKNEEMIDVDSQAKERFWSKVQKGADDECWEWLGRKNIVKGGSGYGYFSQSGRSFRAHRFSYLIHKGELMDGMYICHSCDNPSCVNPAHLWQGTPGDNARDMHNKGRAAPNWKKMKLENKVRGEEHGMSRLTESDVRSILKDNRAYTKIAVDYDVHSTTIGCVKRREVWKHV